MKVLLLADTSSPHSIKWATSLADKDIDICIFGMNPASSNIYSRYPNIQIISLNVSFSVSKRGNFLQKLTYLRSIPLLKKTIKNFGPDIIHAHYASSYGLLGSLMNFHPYVVSVWGTDVYDFPNKSLLHKSILKYNLRRADKVLSTSNALSFQTKKFTTKEIEVIPFGIDLNKFKPLKVQRPFPEGAIVIGTIKMLEEVYGIEYLIKAFDLLKHAHSNISLKLLIVGSGTLSNSLKDLVDKLKLKDDVVFTGQIDFNDIPNYHNMIDIYAALSLRESFGVSVVEASACGKPVVVSDVGGLPEVVENNVTGILVPPKNEFEAYKALERLVLNPSLRKEMGDNGVRRVKVLYNWNDNLDQMIKIYKNIINAKSDSKR